MSTRRIVFVCRSATGEALRYADAIKELEEVFVEIIGVDDDHDAQRLIDAAKKLGNVDRIVTAEETLLLPVAEANEALGLGAMSSQVVSRTLDKSKLEATLRNVGVTTPRDHLVNSSQKLCFDTVTIANEPQCYSGCYYNPSIVDAVDDSARQLRCVMPRDLERYEEFIREGVAAVRALQVGNAMTHLEGFINEAGEPAGFVDVTLTPGGARIFPMFGFAYDVDPYHVWARVAVDDAFDGPLERKYAVGTIFLRGPGLGLVKHITGIQIVQEELNDLLVDARWPIFDATKSATYTGDGFVTLRHRDVTVVERALDFVEQTVRITYSNLP